MGNKVVVGQPAGDWPDDWFEGENAAATDEIRTAIEGVASHDPTTFVRDARVPRAELLPELWDFNRFKELSQKHAMASSAIASMVYKLVPKHCTESEFWRAYWCHVHHVLATAGFQGVPALNQSVLMRQDDMTSNAIIGVFDEYAPFTAFSTREMEAIIERDALDDEKLAAGIKVAIERGVIEANPPVEPVTKIDVMGKSAEEVAQQIISALGDGAQNGCVVVLQGLSGTGKGTTVDRVKHALPNAVTWSNGNVFRALTLLTVTRCQQLGLKADASGARARASAVHARLSTCVCSLAARARHSAARRRRRLQASTRSPRCSRQSSSKSSRRCSSSASSGASGTSRSQAWA